MNFIAHSHLVITTKDVALITDYWSQLLEIEPHFQNKGFSEFVLPSGFRFAFFLPTGKSGQHFSSESDRSQCSFGLTVKDIHEAYLKSTALKEVFQSGDAGAPKEHPWGEKSFLLIDPDGNKWEITESPTQSGMLVNN